MHADWRIAATSGSAGSAQRGIAHAPGELASKTHFHLVQISPSETIPLLRISILFLRSLLSYSFLFFSFLSPGRRQFSLFLLGLKFGFLL